MVRTSYIIYLTSIQISLKLRILPILKSLLLPWNRQWRKIKNKTLRQTWCLHFSKSTSSSSAAIFQHHKCMEFTFHNSFFILELVPSSDFLDAKIQGYVSPRLKSTLQKFYVRHHNLVDCYEISISQMTMDLLLFT